MVIRRALNSSLTSANCSSHEAIHIQGVPSENSIHIEK